MISSTFKAAGCLLFVCCISVCAQTTAKKTATGTIAGKVTLKGEGIAGIVVGARENESDKPRPGMTATTDSQGNYRITNLPPGTYTILPASPQFVVAGNETSKWLILSEGETFDRIDFALVRGGVITGRLTDSEGRPVIEENVQITSPDGIPSESFVSLNLSYSPTDDRGVYRIYGLPPGKYRVSAGAADERLYYDATGRNHYKRTFHPSTTDPDKATLVEVTAGGETTNVDIAFRKPQPAVVVSGKVVDADTGKPIPNVVYGLQKNFKGGSQANSGRLTTSQGEFRFESVTPGSYSVFITSSPALEIYAEPLDFEVTDQNITGLIIKASPPTSISGVIVVEGMDEKAGRALLNGGVVMAESEDGQPRSGHRPMGTISADGSFRLSSLPPGALELSVYPDSRGGRPCEVIRIERNGVVQTGKVQLKERERIGDLRVIVKYHRGGIRGVVKFENGELAANERVHIFAWAAGDDSTQMSAPADGRGRFSLDRLKPGVYELRAVVYKQDHNVRRSSVKQQVVVSDNQVSEVTVTLDLGVR